MIVWPPKDPVLVPPQPPWTPPSAEIKIGTATMVVPVVPDFRADLAAMGRALDEADVPADPDIWCPYCRQVHPAVPACQPFRAAIERTYSGNSAAHSTNSPV